jgi:MFS family permease
MVGKRPVYLMSTTIFLISTVWCALIGKDYGSFFAARFISGLGLGAYEAIVLSTVGDLYLVRQPSSHLGLGPWGELTSN